MKPKYLVVERGWRFDKVTKAYLTEMQMDAKCDTCRKPLPKDTRVLGKLIDLRKGSLCMGTFSPTCLQCAKLN